MFVIENVYMTRNANVIQYFSKFESAAHSINNQNRMVSYLELLVTPLPKIDTSILRINTSTGTYICNGETYVELNYANMIAFFSSEVINKFYKKKVQMLSTKYFQGCGRKEANVNLKSK